jgi:hypothetical protein
MRLWLDTEYNGFQGALISMALVDEDGREWYEVLPCEAPLPWVSANVIPVLGKQATTRERLSKSLAAWLRKYESITVMADWPEDFSHFCLALVTGPGKSYVVPPLTMQLLRSSVALDSAQPHNALADAKALWRAFTIGLAR